MLVTVVPNQSIAGSTVSALIYHAPSVSIFDLSIASSLSLRQLVAKKSIEIIKNIVVFIVYCLFKFRIRLVNNTYFYFMLQI